MKIKYLFIGLLLLTSLEAKTQVLTIDKLIKIALEHSPDIDMSRFDFESAQERTKFSKGFYLPRLDAQVGGGRQYSKFYNQNETTIEMFVGTLGASQLLYDLGANLKTLKPKLIHF
ncbi:MAG: TolC family protein [Sulfurovum sp.]|nr:TolC family protein [Sulfurovum sp.]